MIGEESIQLGETTSSVHFIRFRLADDQTRRLASKPVTWATTLRSFQHAVLLSSVTRASLAADLKAA